MTAETPDTVRFVIDMGPVQVPRDVAREIAQGMRRAVTDALARMDLAALTVGADVLPADLYGYAIDGDAPGGPWPPPLRPIDDTDPF